MLFRSGGADLPIVAGKPVHINGGAGVANERLITPRGVVTEITEEQAQYLRENKVFQLHEENGFVQISAALVDGDIAAADMQGRDNSAPLVDEDMPADLKPTGDDDAPAAQASVKTAGRKRRS